MLAVAALATAVSQSFGRFTYAILLTDVRTDLGVSNTTAGALGSANLAAYLVGTLVVSYALGFVGLATMTKLGLAVVSGGLVLLAWGPGLAVVVVGLVLTGFAAAGVWITAPVLATAELGIDRRGAAIGIVGAGVGIGIVAGSFIDTLVEWRQVYLTEALVGVGVTAAAMLLLRDPGRVSAARPGLSAIRDVPGWGVLLWAYGLFAAGMALVVTFTVALLEDDAGYAPDAAAVAFSLLGVGTVIGGPLFGTMADRFGRRTALQTAFVVMAATVAVVATGQRPGATIAALVFGMAFTGVPVSVGARISDHAQGERFGAAYGAATLAFGAGLTVGPQLGGILADATDSFRPAFAVAVGCAIAGAILTPAATRD